MRFIRSFNKWHFKYRFGPLSKIASVKTFPLMYGADKIQTKENRSQHKQTLTLQINESVNRDSNTV